MLPASSVQIVGVYANSRIGRDVQENLGGGRTPTHEYCLPRRDQGSRRLTDPPLDAGRNGGTITIRGVHGPAVHSKHGAAIRAHQEAFLLKQLQVATHCGNGSIQALGEIGQAHDLACGKQVPDPL